MQSLLNTILEYLCVNKYIICASSTITRMLRSFQCSSINHDKYDEYYEDCVKDTIPLL